MSSLSMISEGWCLYIFASGTTVAPGAFCRDTDLSFGSSTLAEGGYRLWKVLELGTSTGTYWPWS